MRVNKKGVRKVNNYRVQGESRQVGAIGIFEPFVKNVATESSLEAYNQVREDMYTDNREHVHIKQIELVTADGRTTVEPRAYL